MKKNVLLYLSILYLCTTILYSQDIRGVDLIINNMTGRTFQAGLILYTDSIPAINRPFVMLNWGVSNLDTLFLSNQTGLTGGICRKEYTGATFTYPGDGYYIISYADSFRIAGITNILNSQTQPIKIIHENVLNAFLGYNNSPIVSSQTSILINNNEYSYSPNATDLDGDSLFFKLIPCYSSDYVSPDSINIDSLSGIINFFPNQIGTYSIAYKIEEWRLISGQYYFIGSSTHDMPIVVNSLTGINKFINNKVQLSIYPNPAQSYITIEFDLTETKNVSIEIKNILGQTVKTIDNNAFSNGVNKIEFDVSEFSKGLYFVHLQSENGILSKKFIKE